MPASPVEFTHPAVEKQEENWLFIRAALEGERAVVDLGQKVLPMPNAEDRSPANAVRYNQYQTRAVWYPASSRTLKGLTGYVFSKDPVLELPQLLETLRDNVDGSGNSLIQQAKKTLSRVLSLGRCGLLVDYPKQAQRTTRKDLLDGKISPTILFYEPEDIRNWRIVMLGSKKMLDLLVLRERYLVANKDDDEFTIKTAVQYRVLTRTAKGVTGRIYRQASEGGSYEVTETYNPQNKSAKPLTEIPFTFVGVENNDESVDDPPLLDLVNLNFAHYRNSADYEESCYIVGQPTPVISGLTQQWVKEVMNGQMHLGSRAAIPLPVGGTATLLQAAPNILPKEAMEHKERQMVAIGAKLVEQKEVQRTATEAGMEEAAELSILTSAALNVFQAYKMSLEHVGIFVGSEKAAIKFDLSEPLAQKPIKPEEASALVSLYQTQLIDFEETRLALKKSGVAFKEDDEAKASIDAANMLDKSAEIATELALKKAGEEE